MKRPKKLAGVLALLLAIAAAGAPRLPAQQPSSELPATPAASITDGCIKEAKEREDAYVEALKKSKKSADRLEAGQLRGWSIGRSTSAKLRAQNRETGYFIECQNRDIKKSQGQSAENPSSAGGAPVVEIEGRLFIEVEGKEGKKGVALTPVTTETGKPSAALFEYVADDQKRRVFYRDAKNGRAVREVVPVQDNNVKNTFLDKDGKFTLVVHGDDVTYVPAGSNPASRPVLLRRDQIPESKQ